MPLRSHVDLCFFVRFVHIPQSMVNAELNALLQDADSKKRFEAWARYHDAETNIFTMFHETYHFWQGLRLPYLYRFSTAAVRGLVQGFRDFSRQSTEWREWSSVMPQMHVLGLEHRCVCWEDGTIGIVPDDSDISALGKIKAEATLSIIELLEGATSLAEWHASLKQPLQAVKAKASAASDPLLFERWLKRKPSYQEAYKFLCKIVGSAVAIRIFLPLVNAAFHTSDPVRAFLGLIAVFGGQLRTENIQVILRQPEPCRWDDIMQLYLGSLVYEAEIDATWDIMPPVPFCRITLEKSLAVSYKGSEFAHPFLTILARKWQAQATVDPQFQWMLSLPAYFSHGEKLYTEFEPPLTIAHFRVSENEAKTVLIGDQNKGMDLQKLPMQDWLAIYSTMRRATGAFFDRADRLCHHSDCPEYESNYCNCYPVIPQRWQECGFPERVKRLANEFNKL